MLLTCSRTLWLGPMGPSRGSTEPSPACTMTTRMQTFTDQWQAAHAYLSPLKHVMEAILRSYFLYKIFC